jgi:hypothetical protein
MTEGVETLVSALPDRRQLIHSKDEPFSGALEMMQRSKYPDALAYARRNLYVRRITGQLEEELLAYQLLGDVLAEARWYGEAVQCYIAAGRGKSAASIAVNLP